jgi:hypothetical protein
MTSDDHIALHRFRLAAIAFAVGTTIHVADHLRRGQGSVSELLFTLGNTALVLQVVTVTLALVGHRTAPRLAAIAGPSLAVGFLAAHWLPRWSAMSDPVWEVPSLPWLTVMASVAEIAGAVAIGWAGLALELGSVRGRGVAA